MRLKDADVVSDLPSFRGTPRRAFFEGIEAANVKLVADVLRRHPEAVRWRELRDDVQAENEYGLHIAARIGSLDIAKMLLDAGAQVDARDMDGESPVMHAIRHGQEEMTRHLLAAAKANPNHRCGGDETPLMIAAAEGFLAAAEMLLEHGANIQACSRQGNALCYAAGKWTSNEKVIGLLVERGIRHDVHNDDGKTALDIAQEDRRPHADFLAACIAKRDVFLAEEARQARERDIAGIHSGTGRPVVVRKPLSLKISPF